MKSSQVAEPGALAPARAIEDLYRREYRGLTRLAVLLLGDHGRAEEIVQEAFVALFERWKRLQDHRGLPAYLKRSVANAAVSDLRHRRVVRLHRSDDPDHVASAESTAMDQLKHRRVMAALNRLPDRQRAVLILRYYAELSESEIANVLGISKGAVKSHSSRGLRSLRPIMEDEA